LPDLLTKAAAGSAARHSRPIGDLAAVTQANGDGLRLLTDRALSSLHRLGDLRNGRPGFRMRLEIAHIFFGPRLSNGTRNLLCHLIVLLQRTVN
jgi:hypothetical protein